MTITTKPVNSSLVARIETLIPAYCRSVLCLHGDMDADPVRYVAHESEIKYVRRAIRIAKREGGT